MFFAKRSDLPINLTSYDLIKFLALIIMIIDHLGAYFFPEDIWWRVIGRAGLPVWFFLVGYARSQEISKPLIVGALILVGANLVLGQYSFPANALVSIIIVRLVLDKLCSFGFASVEKLIYVFFFLGILSLPSGFLFEYGSIAILLAMFGYCVRNSEKIAISNLTKVIFSILVMTFSTFLQIITFNLGTFESIGCILGMGFFGVILFFFKPAEYPRLTNITPSFMKNMITFGGRYTLEIYVIHLVLFKAITLYLNYGHYMWFSPTLFPNFPVPN